MLAIFNRTPRKFLTFLLIGIIVLVGVVIALSKYTDFGRKKPYIIGVIASKNEMSDQEEYLLHFLIDKRLESINEEGGINGRHVKALFIDDGGNMKKLYRLVEQTSQDENLIAYIGCKTTARAKVIGPLVTRKKIPVLAFYVFSKPVEKFPTMYSMSVGDKITKLVLQKLLEAKATKVGYIGQVGKQAPESIVSVLVYRLFESIISKNPNIKLTIKRYVPETYDFGTEEAHSFIDSLKNNTDFLVVTLNPKIWKSLLGEMKAQNVKLPIFTYSANWEQFNAKTAGFIESELYAINSFGIPGATNAKLGEQLIKFQKKRERPEHNYLKIILLSQAARVSDEIGLLKEASLDKSLPSGANIRDRIITGLSRFRKNNRIFRGWLVDWYFNSSHVYGGPTLIAWKPRNNDMLVMAPYQYRLKDNGQLQQGHVLYTNLDMLQIDRIDDDEGSFYATFYLEINSAEAFSLNEIDFTNAARNEINHQPLIEAELIRSKKDTTGFKFYNNLYKISGKFFYDPDLHKYPLDEQKFPITIQASNTRDFFMIQPSVGAHRDSVFETAGWKYKNQYVGFTQDIVTTLKHFGTTKKNIPYYKFSFVYVLKRTHIDFFLKTLVPLLAILVITYFSVYIPPREFEALAAIQVTGLLSCIALYFSAYKPEMEYATISDQIFIFTYVMITTIIGTSILLYVLHHKNYTIVKIVRFYQQFIFPILVIGFTVFVRWY